MSMIIEFFTVPNKLTQAVKEKDNSIIGLAEYVQSTYELLDEDGQLLDEPKKDTKKGQLHLELYYFPIFGILGMALETVLDADNHFLVLGRQDYANEEADLLLNEYVTYSAGYLTYEDIKYVVEKLQSLSFEDLWEKDFNQNALQEEKNKKLIEKEFGVSGKELLEELLYIKEYYHKYLSFYQKVISYKNDKLGLFISIN